MRVNNKWLPHFACDSIFLLKLSSFLLLRLCPYMDFAYHKIKYLFVLLTIPHNRQNTDLLVKWYYQIQGGHFYV